MGSGKKEAEGITTLVINCNLSLLTVKLRLFFVKILSTLPQVHIHFRKISDDISSALLITTRTINQNSMKIAKPLTKLGIQALTAIAIASSGLSVSLTPGMAQTKPTISVPDFKNETTWWWWQSGTARQLGDALSNELSATGNFQVVERQKLDAVLSEQELAELGLVRRDTAAKKGQLTGAQYVVLGRITAYEEDVEQERNRVGIGGINIGGVRIGGGGSNEEQKAYIAVDLRVVDTTTGEVVHSHTVEGRATSKGQEASGNINILGMAIGGGSESKKRAPVGKALRAALIESSNYLSCVMVKKDACIQKYQAQDNRRRENTQDVLKLE